jgi:hypothetical protein
MAHQLERLIAAGSALNRMVIEVRARKVTVN